MHTETPATANEPREHIVFRMGGQEFCLDVMAIREIRGWSKVTPLPRAPQYVRGVVNLRGTVLPILDLGARLGFTASEESARSAIIVADVRGQTVGLMVDGVSDIMTLQPDAIQSTPEVAEQEARSCIRGIVPVEGRMIGVLALGTVVPDISVPLAA